MMALDAMKMTAGKFVRKFPESEEVFRLLNLSLDAKTPLGQVVETRGWPEDILALVLDDARGDSSADPLELRMHRSVVAYVRDRYHKSLDGELKHIERLLIQAAKSHHADVKDRIRQIRKIFKRLSRQLRAHVNIEEELLFPNLCDGGRGGVGQLALREMDREHDFLKSSLREIAELTLGQAVPSEDGDSLISLLEELDAFDMKLRQHATVENDFLWPATAAVGPEKDTESIPAGGEGRMCPRTGQPCPEGHPLRCSQFWDCLQNAIRARWDAASEDAAV